MIMFAHGSPRQDDLSYTPKYFDVQVRNASYVTHSLKPLTTLFIKGHRGSRGEAIENSLPAFAW